MKITVAPLLELTKHCVRPCVHVCVCARGWSGGGGTFDGATLISGSDPRIPVSLEQFSIVCSSYGLSPSFFPADIRKFTLRALNIRLFSIEAEFSYSTFATFFICILKHPNICAAFNIG